MQNYAKYVNRWQKPNNAMEEDFAQFCPEFQKAPPGKNAKTDRPDPGIGTGPLSAMERFVFEKFQNFRKNVENRAKKGPCKKRAFSAKKGSYTDFSYNSLIKNKIMDM